ncbi:hypothetical protein Tco_1472500, partial [Tanacetum coccineum]
MSQIQMSKGISLTFSVPTRHTNKKLAQTCLHHRHNTHNLCRHSNNISILVRNMGGKRVAKRATVDLVNENEEEEEAIRQCARWTREEEILLTQCWIETSENGQIGADRSEESTNADCQKFNAIYKHLERKSGENEADHIEAAKITFTAQQPNGRKFQLEHAWRILKGHSKWDAPKPLETS